MYELIQASERSGSIRRPARIGLVRRNGQDVRLIGSGKDAALSEDNIPRWRKE